MKKAVLIESFTRVFVERPLLRLPAGFIGTCSAVKKRCAFHTRKKVFSSWPYHPLICLSLSSPVPPSSCVPSRRRISVKVDKLVPTGSSLNMSIMPTQNVLLKGILRKSSEEAMAAYRSGPTFSIQDANAFMNVLRIFLVSSFCSFPLLLNSSPALPI
jgi:hypothetical protein